LVRNGMCVSSVLCVSLLALAYPARTLQAVPTPIQAPVEVSVIRERLTAIRKAHLGLRSLSGAMQIRFRTGKDTLKFDGSFAFAKPNRARAGFTVSGALKELEFPIPADMQASGKAPAGYTITNVSDGAAQYILRKPNMGKYFKRPSLKGQANIASTLDSALVGNAVTKMYLNADQILPEPFEKRLSNAKVTETVREGVPVTVFDLKATIQPGDAETADRAKLVVGKSDNVVRELVVTGIVQGKPTEVALIAKNLRVNPTLAPATFQFARPKGLKEVQQAAQ
jgi:outer membrane lipoprotein-sorting protein